MASDRCGHPSQPVIVVENRAHAGWCPFCQKFHYAPLPGTVTEGGLIDPRLQALIAWLKGKAHASYTIIAEFFEDVLWLDPSRGFMAKCNQATPPRCCLFRLQSVNGYEQSCRASIILPYLVGEMMHDEPVSFRKKSVFQQPVRGFKSG